MRSALILGGLALTLAGAGCRHQVAGKCDCTNQPESAVIVPPGNPYPVVSGGSAPAMTSPTPGMTPPSGNPMAMPAPDKLPPVNGK